MPSRRQVTNETSICAGTTMKQMGPNNMLHMKTADSVTDNHRNADNFTHCYYNGSEVV